MVVAIGSPLGPTLANIFVCYYKVIWLDYCPPESKPVCPGELEIRL